MSTQLVQYGALPSCLLFTSAVRCYGVETCATRICTVHVFNMANLFKSHDVVVIVEEMDV